MKSKNRSISKPVAPPKVVTNDAENLSARNISFVVQGQIQPETYTFLQALRRNFPEAELVLSTWRGKYDPCFRRITDKMIYCKDPGAVVCSYYREVVQWNNLNRQLVTTMAGLMRLRVRSSPRCERTSRSKTPPCSHFGIGIPNASPTPCFSATESSFRVCIPACIPTSRRPFPYLSIRRTCSPLGVKTTCGGFSVLVLC